MKKKLFLLIISILVFFPCKVSAQETLPAGGDSFETAVPLSPGEYQGRAFGEDEDSYYSISNIQPGQEIQAQVLFSGNTNLGFFLYDQNKQKLTKKEYVGEDDNSSLYWLNGTPSSQKCYVQIKNQAINAATLKSVSIKITDRFDAGSQTDAGGSFENALPIEAGQYKGFLDFNYEASDGEDFYKISVARGQKLTIKVTPPKDLCLDLKIYDKNRSELVDETSDNEGAIVTGSIQALTADIFYIAVAPEYSSELDQASQYSLDISGAAPNTQKSGIANIEKVIKEGNEILPDNPLSQISASVSSGILGIIGKSIKFILLIAATVLIIIVVTVILLLGKSSKSKVAEKEVPPKEKTPVKNEETREENKKTAKSEFIYCSKCGAKNPAGGKFCSKCGEKLT